VSAGSALVLLFSLVVSSAFLLLVVLMIWFADRYDREPLHMVAAVFLWGAAVAPTVAILLLSGVGEVWRAVGVKSLPLDSLSGPLVEEFAKAAGVVLVVLLTRNFDNPTDGIVYGTAVGLGFAVTENSLYGLGRHGTPPLDIHGLVILSVGRTLLSAGIHAVSSAIFGGSLGLALFSRRWILRLTWTTAGLIAATAMHGSWNAALVLVGPFKAGGGLRSWLLLVPAVYAVYLLVLTAFLRSEQTILKRQLAEEVSLKLAPQWVLDVIPYYRRRVRGDWWPNRAERTVIARLLTRVAYRKHALQHLPTREAAIASLEVVRLRQRLRSILTPLDVEDD
jgi:RsiW-degrading membrane proteinase PrsW (M82 family)